MDKKTITLAVLKTLAQKGLRYVPAAVSNRHVHLCRQHVQILFGSNYRLSVRNELSQPGQYACQETLKIIGAKGSIDNIRILGPERNDTQVEISVTDSFLLGIQPVIRMSGDIAGTPGAKLVGPKGEVVLKEGVIISKRHLHISLEQAELYKLKNEDMVDIIVDSNRRIILGDVAVRAGDKHFLELHIDMDEANAGLIQNGRLLKLESK